MTVPFSRFLSYDKGEDGNLVVNQEQATIVRRIYKNEVRCKTPYLDEEDIKSRFITAVDILLSGGKDAIRAFEKAKAAVFDLTELTARQTELRNEMEVVSQMIQQCIRENATVTLDQADYNQRFEALSRRFEAAKKSYNEVTETIKRQAVPHGADEGFPKAPESAGR